jgi:hypothetical protein
MVCTGYCWGDQITEDVTCGWEKKGVHGLLGGPKCA